MTRNMVTRRIESILILRQNKEDPSDAEWDECLRLLVADRDKYPMVKVLVVTDGGGPSPAQRKRLDVALRGLSVRVAVVSESIKVRFVVSSVALLSLKIRSFRAHELELAYLHLKLTKQEQPLAQAAVSQMNKELLIDK